jgi:serine/threonine protein phosphatase PrpC
MIQAHGATHPGRVRQQNEDAMLLDPELGLFAVADGMGGHNAGEVASALAIETLRSFAERSRHDPDHTWPFGIESSLDFNGNRLRTGIKLANRRVFRESERRDQYTGMGSTMVAILVEGTCAMICGVGDSRVYSVRAGRIERLTQDHTWVEMLLAQNPGLDPRSVANHPMRHVLTSVVGAQDDLEVTITSRPCVPGDTFVLCSDGVHGGLPDDEIARIVSRASDPRQAAEALVAAALDRDGRDNLTAVVVSLSS